MRHTGLDQVVYALDSKNPSKETNAQLLAWRKNRYKKIMAWDTNQDILKQIKESVELVS